MDDRYRRLVEKLAYARPTTEAEARRALEWVAAREGKPLDEFVTQLSRTEPLGPSSSDGEVAEGVAALPAATAASSV